MKYRRNEATARPGGVLCALSMAEAEALWSEAYGGIFNLSKMKVNIAVKSDRCQSKGYAVELGEIGMV